MSKIKVIHVQVIPKLSGCQLFSLNLLASLPDDEYDKYVMFSSYESVSTEQKSELIDQFSQAGVTILWSPSLRRSIGIHDVHCFFEHLAIFKKYNFDIVHTNSTKPGIISRVAARVAGIKKILHTVHGIAYHANLSFFKRLFFYAIEAFSTPFCHYNVCVNQYYLKYYKWLPFSHSLTVYNGLDFSALSTKSGVSVPARSFELLGRPLRLLFVGRLDDQKDPLTLLRAFNILVEDRGNDFELSMVGDGELMDCCHDYCEEHSLLDKVNFHGWVSEPQKFYAEADIFVSSSIYEAFGFTLVEAAYYGLPIVASNVEGVPEVVLEHKMGLLVKPQDPVALALAISDLAADPVLRSSFSSFGHSSVISRFNLDKMITGYRTLYDAK